MGLGRRIIQLRKENGYTREKLAEILGISPYTLRNYELEVTDAGHPFLIKVSDLFNVSIDYLMGVTEEREKMTSHSLKSSEYDMVEKYRFISTHSPDGAVVVDTVLDREHAIAEKLKKSGLSTWRKGSSRNGYFPSTGRLPPQEPATGSTTSLPGQSRCH